MNTEDASKLSLLLVELLKFEQPLSVTKKLHAVVIRTQHSLNSFCATRIIRLYAINGDLASARDVFKRTAHRSVFLWNSIIRGYARNYKYPEALFLFRKMLKTESKPDRYTFTCISKACTDHLDPDALRSAHCLALLHGLGRDLFLGATLVNAYTKFRDLDRACKVFDGISDPDAVLCNSMISGYGSCGLCGEAISLFGRMQRTGLRSDGRTLVALLSCLPDVRFLGFGRGIHGYSVKSFIVSVSHVGSALVSMYSTCDCLVSAEKVFAGMITHDVVTWSALVTGFYGGGCYRKALELFRAMNRTGKKADRVLFAISLAVCAGLADIRSGREVHASVYRQGFELDVMVSSSLAGMYSKCGSTRLCIMVMENLPMRNTVCYNSAILGIGLNGEASNAFSVFEKMLDEHVEPDRGTFSALLCTCCSAGLLEEGRRIFKRMRREFGIEPATEHYVYMVKLLAVAGKVGEAYEMIQTIEGPIDSGICGALISGCDVLIVDDASKMIENERSAQKVMLSNMHAERGRWDDVLALRDHPVGSASWKVPAVSWCAI